MKSGGILDFQGIRPFFSGGKSVKKVIFDKNRAKSKFVRNFRDHMEGKFGFQEWFEKHKALENQFGPEPWPGLDEYSAIA